jgi:hypothetical protein
LTLGQKDFQLIKKPEEISNSGGISEYNTLPKFWNEREIKMDEKLKV